MILYIVRHADPDYDNGTITQQGHREAEALGEWMVLQKPDKLYSSPLGRAVHTMEYTAKRCGLNGEQLEWSAEITGMYQEIEGVGKVTPFNVPGEYILDKEPFPAHDNWGENPYFTVHQDQLPARIDEIRRGSDELLEKHGYRRVGGRYEVLRPNKERVAVFCHGGLGVTWLAHLLQIPISIAWSGFWLAPSSVTTVVMDQRSEQWAVPRCIGLGETPHLYKSGLPLQYRGIPEDLF
ncbi:histidine phosphatase family protein [Paenibacillus senegalensis]|uniref:histidine phosphatase family protein n=1 Tax=Paenibacillus senegalensis TaxID=1465766 RepID=UPI000288F4FB|nr:histidine phosphatase family protein [Paenibacillus senegalensis]